MKILPGKKTKQRKEVRDQLEWGSVHHISEQMTARLQSIAARYRNRWIHWRELARDLKLSSPKARHYQQLKSAHRYALRKFDPGDGRILSRRGRYCFSNDPREISEHLRITGKLTTELYCSKESGNQTHEIEKEL